MATAKKATKDVTETIEAITADTQKAAKEQFDKLTVGLEQMTSFGQENVDAVMKTQEIAGKALEGFGAEVSAFTKKSFETTVSAAQDMAAAKNVTELFEKQAAFAKSYFDGVIKQTTKMNDMAAATAKDVAEPMTARITAASDAMKSMSV